jgi:hypothetical protein
MKTSLLVNASSVLFPDHSVIEFPVPGFDRVRTGAQGRKGISAISAAEAIVVLVGNGFSEWKLDSDDRVKSARYNSGMMKPRLRDGSYAKHGSNRFGTVVTKAGGRFSPKYMTLMKDNGHGQSKVYELTSAGWELFDEVYKRLSIRNPRMRAPSLNSRALAAILSARA